MMGPVTGPLAGSDPTPVVGSSSDPIPGAAAGPVIRSAPIATARAAIVLAAALSAGAAAWWLIGGLRNPRSAAPIVAAAGHGARATGPGSTGGRPHRTTPLDTPPSLDTTPGGRPHAAGWTRQFRDEICACTDAACVRDVGDRYAAQIGTVVVDGEDSELVTSTLHDSAACEQRIVGAPLTPTSGG
jgi:hypothetical protein